MAETRKITIQLLKQDNPKQSKMFKVLAISALFLVFATDATNLVCKSEGSNAVGGACPAGQTIVGGGYSCCNAADVYDADAFECSEESLGPALGGWCPEGFLVVGEECCSASAAHPKSKK